MPHKMASLIVWNPKTGGWIARIPSVAFLLLLIVASCALPPKQGSSVKSGQAHADATAAEREPKLGDLKTVDGVEYVYGKNVRWPTLPGEPEYVWIRKDQYSPRLFDSLKETPSDAKEMEELERRLERLEAEIRRLDSAPGAQERR